MESKTRTKPNRPPRAIVLDRREKVKKLHFFNRKTIREIAKILGWNPETIWSDLQYINAQFAKQASVIDVKQILGSILLSRNEILREINEVSNHLDFPGLENSEVGALRTKLLALKTMDEIQQKNINDLQQLGFIEKPKENIEVEHRDYKFIIEDGSKRNTDKVESKSKTKKSVSDSK